MTCDVCGIVASDVGSGGEAGAPVLPPFSRLAVFCSCEGTGGMLWWGSGGYMSVGEESTSTRV